MARKNPKSAPETSEKDPWRSLTWDDLESWAGSRSLERGRSYQRSGRVRQLARSAEGVLLAWVQGTQRYVTEAALSSGSGDGVELSARCTCPLGISGCKHAVAVVVEYLNALKNGVEVPQADPEDPRWQLLDEPGALDEEEDFESEEGEASDAEENVVGDDDQPVTRWTRPKPRKPFRAAKSRSGREEELRQYLEGLPVADLATFILQLAEDYPEVKKDLARRSALARGNVGELIRQARKEIVRLTSEQVWSNHWSGEGNVPDYGELRELFEQLLAHSQADALVELGEALFTAGQEQVGSAHDEGETAEGIGLCLTVVFRAVLASSRSDRDKLLTVIDVMERDEYDLCQGAEVVLDKDWPPAVWSAAADELAQRLRDRPNAKSEDDFSRSYRRDHLSNWLIDCLHRAGREAEVLPLCEAEAPITGSYERLVNELIAAGRLEDASRQALEGIKRVGQKWPGIAQHLRERLRDLAEGRQDWSAVAAFHAEEFFEHPSVHGLERLYQTAEKAGVGEQVRAAALHFLETGVRPKPEPAAITATRPRKAAGKRTIAPRRPAGPAWPLPEFFPEAQLAKERGGFVHEGPHFDVLLELALQEKRPDDVLRWYDQLARPRRTRSYGWGGVDHQAGRVADAVAETHPDRAIALYRQIIEDYVAQTSPSAYEAARPYLRKLGGLLGRLGREAEWSQYLGELQDNHRRKRRFMEVLDRLESRPIVDE